MAKGWGTNKLIKKSDSREVKKRRIKEVILFCKISSQANKETAFNTKDVL